MDLTKPPLHPPPATADLIPHLMAVDDFLAALEAHYADQERYRAPSVLARARQLERIRTFRLYVEDAARAIQAGIKRRAAPPAPQPAAPAQPAKPQSLF
ncbi:MAG: hypothetical protein HS116_02285 [Planctomycetes bacterium]|nr:hypothetical protein [Planctomycetota bacterium]